MKCPTCGYPRRDDWGSCAQPCPNDPNYRPSYLGTDADRQCARCEPEAISRERKTAGGAAAFLIAFAFGIFVAGMLLYARTDFAAVPHCKIIDGREINDHHCIPYCPPDPKECG